MSPTMLVGAIADWLTQYPEDLYRFYLLTFMFHPLPGSPATVLAIMRQDLERFYTRLLTRTIRNPAYVHPDKLLPVLIAAPDAWVFKRDNRARLRDVQINAIAVAPYIAAQVIGAIVASAALYAIASGKAGWTMGGFASNGYGSLSPGNYDMGACFVAELILTFFFLLIIIGSTSKGAAVGFAGIPLGLGLTLIHLVSIPVTNTSVNPARSTGPALFAGGAYIAQLWLFWLAPILGAAIAGLVTRWLYAEEKVTETVVVVERQETTI